MIPGPIENLSRNNSILKDTIVQIQDNNYVFDVRLISGDGEEVGLKFSAIEELKIIDDLKNFGHYGHIIFENTLDVIESLQYINSNYQGKQSSNFKPYVFRGDGRDFLIINIFPQIKQDDFINSANSFATEKSFGLSFIFSIYDYEDILTQDKDVKFKKLYFWDYTYQILSERDSYFSTGNISQGLSNSDRSIYSGDAIKELLKKTFVEDINSKINFSKLWDTGNDKIFYSSNPGFKAIDDLNYLLNLHVSNRNNFFSPCILRKERTGDWSLLSIYQYFKAAYFKGTSRLGDVAGGYFIENMVLGKLNAGNNDNNAPSRRPGVNLNTANFPDYSIIEDFHLSNMSASDSQSFITSHYVHNYDLSKKLFSIDCKDNNINNSLQIYNNLFVSSLKGKAGNSPTSNLNLNKLRKEGKNIKNVYNVNYNENLRLNSGRNKILLSSLFLNTTISFRARGSTKRQAGRFISIDRADAAFDNKFDNKMLGIYLILSVEHTFAKGSYYNNLKCSKTYNVESSGIGDNVV